MSRKRRYSNSRLHAALFCPPNGHAVFSRVPFGLFWKKIGLEGSFFKEDTSLQMGMNFYF
jgi:hypothetical protein